MIVKLIGSSGKPLLINTKYIEAIEQADDEDIESGFNTVVHVSSGAYLVKNGFVFNQRRFIFTDPPNNVVGLDNRSTLKRV